MLDMEPFRSLVSLSQSLPTRTEHTGCAARACPILSSLCPFMDFFNAVQCCMLRLQAFSLSPHLPLVCQLFSVASVNDC